MKLFEKNVGQTERIIRVAAGLLILAAGLYYNSYLGLVGLIPLITGAVGSCPLYSLLGINTCKRK